jgi:hypothetical protein
VASHLQIRGDRGGHPFSEAFDLRSIHDVLDHNDELVPTEASDPILGAQRAPNPVRDGGQHLVTGRMAEGVVDDLEVVQVHEQGRHRGAQSFRGRKIRFENVQDPGPVMQPGQRVVKGLVGQRLLSLVLRGDVLQLDHAQVRLSHPARDRHHQMAHPDRGSVFPHQPHLPGDGVARCSTEPGTGAGSFICVVGMDHFT